MKITVKKRIGMIFLILIHVSLLVLIAGYIGIACSTKIDNLCHMPYEPSGMQMLYFYFNVPLFLVISTVNYSLNIWLKINRAYALNPLIIWFIFCVFLEYTNNVVHFPAGNALFYQGTFYIAAASLFLLIISAYWQIKDLLKKACPRFDQ